MPDIALTLLLKKNCIKNSSRNAHDLIKQNQETNRQMPYTGILQISSPLHLIFRVVFQKLFHQEHEEIVYA